MGIDLSHREEDILRATFEGIALGLRSAFEGLQYLTQVEGDLLVVGGGSQGSLWRQILADVLGVRIVRTCISQEAAALGAAALAAVGCGLWTGFDRIDRQHKFRRYSTPDPEAHKFYDELYRVFLQRRRDCRDVDAALACLGSMTSP